MLNSNTFVIFHLLRSKKQKTNQETQCKRIGKSLPVLYLPDKKISIEKLIVMKFIPLSELDLVLKTATR